MRKIIAVGIALLNEENQVLIVQRPEHKPLGLKWEFPGVKDKRMKASKHVFSVKLKKI